MHSDEDGAGSSKEPSRRRRGRRGRRDGDKGHDLLDLLTDALGIQLLRVTLQREAMRFGHGSWRVAQDVIDRTMEIVEDYAIDPGHPRLDNWLALSITIYRNLVRSGPGSGPLDIQRTLSWPDTEMAAPEPEDTPPSPPLALADLPMDLLTKAEEAAVIAYFEARNVSQAAKALGETRRDLRVRLGRAFRKFRDREG